MTSLMDLLGPEFDTPEARLSAELSREDQHLLGKLVQHRIDCGLSQADIAEAMGVTQPTVSAFERLGNDPHMSTVRRYALALGVVIRHHFEVATEDSCDSHVISFIDADGIHSHLTATATARLAAPWPVTSKSGTVSTKIARHNVRVHV